MSSLLLKIEKFLLYGFLILLPFHLYVGKVFPSIVIFPLYMLDIFILGFGILWFVKFYPNYKNFNMEQRPIFLFFFLFIALSSASIIINREIIIQWVQNNNINTVLYTGFKNLLASEPVYAVGSVFRLFLAFFVFAFIVSTRVKKRKILQFSCCVTFFIFLSNIFLFIFDNNVSLDAGRIGAQIRPYSIHTAGVYFPFVNSTLLSLYTSCYFFIFIYLFGTERKKFWRYFYGSGIFISIIMLDLAEGRAPLATVLLLFIFFLIFNFMSKSKLASTMKKNFSNKFLLCIFIVLLMVTIHLFLLKNMTFDNVFYKSYDEWTDPLKTTTEQQNHERQNPIENTVENTQIIELIKKDDNEVRTSTSYVEATVKSIAEKYTYWYQQRRLHYHWPVAFTIFQQEPLFGVGTGLFYYSVLYKHKDALCKKEYVMPDGFYITLCPDKNPEASLSSTAHSIYLQVLAEQGIVGLFMFTSMFVFIFMFAVRKVKKNPWQVFIFLPIMAISMEGIFFSYFVYGQMLFFFWFLVGILFKNEVM